MTTAQGVLHRFNKEINWAVHQVQSRFGNTIAEPDDTKQEAKILVLTYAGLLPGRHSNKLRHIEQVTEGDDKRLHSLLATTLRLDLVQIIARKMDPIPTISLNTLTGTKYEPSDEEDLMEDRTIRKHDFAHELPRLREEYPYLIMTAVDCMTWDEIIAKTGISRMTLSRRLAAEKRRARQDSYFWPLARDGRPSKPSSKTQDDLELTA